MSCFLKPLELIKFDCYICTLVFFKHLLYFQLLSCFAVSAINGFYLKSHNWSVLLWKLKSDHAQISVVLFFTRERKINMILAEFLFATDLALHLVVFILCLRLTTGLIQGAYCCTRNHILQHTLICVNKIHHNDFEAHVFIYIWKYWSHIFCILKQWHCAQKNIAWTLFYG